MTHEPGSKAAQWSAHIQDILADNSKIREGLHDDDAIPYVDWGAVLADGLGGRIARPDTPDLGAEQVSEVGFGLSKLMIRLNWLVTYRNKKDEAWLTRTFAMVNKLSQDLWGDDAPIMDDAQIVAWLADRANHPDGDLIRDLMQRFTPPALVAPPEVSPDDVVAPPDKPPSPLASFLSNAVFGSPDEPVIPGEDNGEKFE